MLLIIDIIWIVFIHVWGHFYLSRNRKLTVSAISRTIVYDEIPIICGCCFCNYQRSYTIPFEDIAEVSHQIEERNRQILQVAVFELRNGGYFTPDVELSQPQYEFIKKTHEIRSIITQTFQSVIRRPLRIKFRFKQIKFRF
ncbi:MAG: hypothetical protein EZS28_021769, partial [Streblomastix strix]